MATLLLTTGSSTYGISTDGDPIEPPLPPPGYPEQPLSVPPVGEPAPGAVHYGYNVIVSGLVYDVTSYGALGDGVTNDTVAIRAAVAACKAAGGGHVYFPAGTYIVAPTEEFSQVIRVDFGNVAFVGDGADVTELRCFAWGMQHPQNEVVENKGFGFRCGINNTTLISNIVFAGLFMNGQTTPNTFAGGWQGTLYATDTERWAEAEAVFPPGTLSGLTEIPIRAVGWDINHKAVATWGMTDKILVTDCKTGGWRGEILYSGGDKELGRYYIARTDIWNSNGSATSIGHRTIYDYVNVWAVYNGVENFCRGISNVPDVGAQGAWLRNCNVRAGEDWPVGYTGGAFGVVYLGFRDSWLTIENCNFGQAYTAAIFLSEYAHNVTVRNNTFVDVQPVHMHNLSLYTSDPSDERYAGYTNLLFEYNVCTTPTKTFTYWLTNYSGKGVPNNSDWRFLHNTITGSFSNFFTGTACTLGEWRMEYNDFSGISKNPVNIGATSRRPTFIDNILPVTHDYDMYADTPLELPTSYPWQRVGVIGSSSSGPDEVEAQMNIDLSLFPDNFDLFICREAPTRSDKQGAQVRPAAWNNLTRGYGIYRNSKLTLRYNLSTNKFEFISYIPPTTAPWVITDTVNRIRFRGWDTVTMNPTSPVVYGEITGLPQNLTGLIYHNANVIITHQPGLVECPGGVDYSPGASGFVYVYWDGTTYTLTT